MLSAFFLIAKGLLGGVFDFVVKYWKIVVPVLIVLGTLWYVHHLRAEVVKDQAQIVQDAGIIKDWDTKFNTLEKDAKQAEDICKATIADQNKHVDEIAQQADKYKQAAAQASKANSILKKQYEAKIQDILNQPKPKDDHASIQYLIDFAKGAGKWEEPKHE
jgi:DNA-binding helix-hairpin-helix protein with protein kinase domain